MLRLWNMLDGRCSYKKKLGLNKEDDKMIDFKVRQVKWEISKGEEYAIMYDKQVEVLRVDSDQPINTISAVENSHLVSMDFINENEIIVADKEGNFTLARNIIDPEKTEICMNRTKCDRFKELKVFPGGNAVASISHDGKICLWDVDSLRTYGQDITTVKAKKTITSK